MTNITICNIICSIMTQSPNHSAANVESKDTVNRLGSRLSDRFNLGEELAKEEPTMAGAVLRAANEVYDRHESMRLRAEKAELESRLDPLTGLLNQRGLEYFVNDWANKENVSNETKIVIVAIDINNLKVTNDTLGHEAGDELIIWVADILKDIAGSDLREGDSAAVARMGEKGDEFFLALPARDVLGDSSQEGGDPMDVVRQKLDRLLKEKSRTRMYAVGICVSTRGELLEDGGFDAAKRAADGLMMDSKAKMKSE